MYGFTQFGYHKVLYISSYTKNLMLLNIEHGIYTAVKKKNINNFQYYSLASQTLLYSKNSKHEVTKI